MSFECLLLTRVCCCCCHSLRAVANTGDADAIASVADSARNGALVRAAVALTMLLLWLMVLLLLLLLLLLVP
jgi:hypothetical protein